jgi:hypothetical protein
MCQNMLDARGEDGPLWIATTKADCDGLKVVLWTGVSQNGEPAPAPFWRMYWDGDKPPPGIKTFKEVNGAPYFRGKRCVIAE